MRFFIGARTRTANGTLDSQRQSNEVRFSRFDSDSPPPLSPNIYHLAKWIHPTFSEWAFCIKHVRISQGEICHAWWQAIRSKHLTGWSRFVLEAVASFTILRDGFCTMWPLYTKCSFCPCHVNRKQVHDIICVILPSFLKQLYSWRHLFIICLFNTRI